MNSFLTGSRVYGSPTRDSDIDLVVLVSPKDLTLLERASEPTLKEHRDTGTDSDPGQSPEPDRWPSASLKFGSLNLIVVTDPIAFAVWKRGTVELQERRNVTGRPITRLEATNHFRALRKKHGLSTLEPVEEEEEAYTTSRLERPIKTVIRKRPTPQVQNDDEGEFPF